IPDIGIELAVRKGHVYPVVRIRSVAFGEETKLAEAGEMICAPGGDFEGLRPCVITRCGQLVSEHDDRQRFPGYDSVIEIVDGRRDRRIGGGICSVVEMYRAESQLVEIYAIDGMS